MADRTTVIMLKPYGPNFPGDRCGFAPHVAEKLIAQGYCKIAPSPGGDEREKTPRAAARPPEHRAMMQPPSREPAAADEPLVAEEPEGLAEDAEPEDAMPEEDLSDVERLKRALAEKVYHEVYSLTSKLLPEGEKAPRTKPELYERARELVEEA